MKNTLFSIIDDAPGCGNLFTNLTTYLAYDHQQKDLYFERTEVPMLSERFETTVSTKQAIKRLREMGLLIENTKQNAIVFKHAPTGEQLSIAVNSNRVLIGSHFLVADDAPVSYLTDTCSLLNELFCKEAA